MFTFEYSGREPLQLESFLQQRPDVTDLYICDVLLSTGSLLYRSRGGIGLCTENYISGIHGLIQKKFGPELIKSSYEEIFKKRFTKWRYFAARYRFNHSSKGGLLSLEASAQLYALWVASGFSHRYRSLGFDGRYLPTKLPLSQLEIASEISRNKKLLFRQSAAQGGIGAFPSELIHDEMLIYAHLPFSFGTYGSGFLWNKLALESVCSFLSEKSKTHRVCVSLTTSRRDASHIAPFLPKLGNIYVTKNNSDIFLLNF